MAADTDIPVSTATHWLTGLVANHPHVWAALGNLETKLLPELSDIEIHAPVYVSGLARSGSTILLEMLASHPDAATHRYSDFPFLFTPCWWNFMMKLSDKKPAALQERAHGDGILVNRQSPEAMEEMLWMAFFDGLHHPDTPHILDTTTQNSAFEAFYRDHLKKILHIRKAPRYITKANYNTTRLAYIHRLFPDARFIIPIRHPLAQVESLMRQHARFTKVANCRVTLQMQASGHFEFGTHRKSIHTGDTARMKELIAADMAGDNAKYYALQWDMIYGFLYRQLHEQPALAKAVLVVPFEECCAKPQEILQDVFSHCRLAIDEKTLAEKAVRIRTPAYASTLSAKEVTTINDICNETAQRYGY